MKGPPDGPPIFLIFVEMLKCPQSQAYQSISPVGTGLSLPDGALGVSLGTSIGNYSPLIAQQPVKLKIRWAYHPCRFESDHRHQTLWSPWRIRWSGGHPCFIRDVLFFYKQVTVYPGRTRGEEAGLPAPGRNLFTGTRCPQGRKAGRRLSGQQAQHVKSLEKTIFAPALSG